MNLDGLGLQEMYINFNSSINDTFGVQGESNARGLKFKLVDNSGKVIDKTYDVYWDMSIGRGTLPNPIKAVKTGEWYYIYYPKIASQTRGRARGQITIQDGDKVLRTKPYNIEFYENVQYGGENLVELEFNADELRRLIAEGKVINKESKELQTELGELSTIMSGQIQTGHEMIEQGQIALDRIENAYEMADEVEEMMTEANSVIIQGKDTILIAEDKISQAEQLISNGNQMISDGKELNSRSSELIKEQESIIAENKELIEVTKENITMAEEIISESEQVLSDVKQATTNAEQMVSRGEQILAEAEQAIQDVNNAIEQGIDDEIQQIIEDKIAELSVSYTQLEDKPSLNGVELVGNIDTKDLNIKSSDLENDKGFITLDEVSVIEGPKGEPGSPGRDGIDGSPGKDGKSIEYKWKGTELGIRQEGGLLYDYVNLKGEKGEPGVNGLDGKDGERGPQGIQGPPGEDGKDGRDGNDFNLPVTMNDGDYLVSNLIMYNRTSHLMPFPEFYFNSAIRADHLYASQGATIKGRTIFESDGGTSTVSFDHDYVDIRGKKIVVEDDKGLGTVKDIGNNSNKTVWTGTESQLPSSRSSSVIYFVIE